MRYATGVRKKNEGASAILEWRCPWCGWMVNRPLTILEQIAIITTREHQVGRRCQLCDQLAVISVRWKR